MSNLNSYDSFKKDAGDVIAFVALVAIIFWAVFYPFAIMVGSANIEAEDRPKYWRRFWKAPATWIWFLCVIILSVMIAAQWGVIG